MDPTSASSQRTTRLLLEYFGANLGLMIVNHRGRASGTLDRRLISAFGHTHLG